MKIKKVLLFIISSAIALASTIFAEEPESSDSTDSTGKVVSECAEGSEFCERNDVFQSIALHKRCEDDPEWCEDKLNVEIDCVKNPESCEKEQENPIDKQTASVPQESIQEQWCQHHREICEQLQANTKKLADLEKQIDELRRELKKQNIQQKNETSIEETPKIKTHSTNQ